MIRGIKPFIENYDKINFKELNKFELLSRENLKLKKMNCCYLLMTM
ncbi:hypothetical protein JCM19275_1479 [Nonlabens ulvanivorans]|uniref:Uncharacterized protein n=1 Tax=Nonlabens ulvanivorans TaxID=906888 RepID=A0A090WJD3_NONUL|nr:hypothetical protein JCM19275_1479 [Nonlabens ulvanivorans]